MLDELGSKLDKVIEKVDLYSEWKRLFRKKPHEFQFLDASRDRFAERKNLWRVSFSFLPISFPIGRGQMDHLSSSMDFYKFHFPECRTNTRGSYDFLQKSSRNGKKDKSVTLDFVYFLKTKGQSCKEVKSTIEQFKTHVPILLDLANPAMKKRHWEKIFKQMKK